jgi:hypothetical protein
MSTDDVDEMTADDDDALDESLDEDDVLLLLAADVLFHRARRSALLSGGSVSPLRFIRFDKTFVESGVISSETGIADEENCEVSSEGDGSGFDGDMS